MKNTEKRSCLLREWLLSVHGNNENYYYSTLFTGIPDGDDYETVVDDLQEGFYDDVLDEMLEMYRQKRELYGNDGWYVNDCVIYEYITALENIEKSMSINIPQKIYKHRTAL